MFIIPQITQQPHASSIEDRLLWPSGVARNSNNHSHVSFPAFLPDLNHIWNFATHFRKSAQNQKFTEIGAVRVADRRRDRYDEANMRFSRLCNRALRPAVSGIYFTKSVYEHCFLHSTLLSQHGDADSWRESTGTAVGGKEIRLCLVTSRDLD